jgi:hypothetical protein
MSRITLLYPEWLCTPALCLDRGCAMFAVQESALDRRNNTSREDTPGR